MWSPAAIKHLIEEFEKNECLWMTTSPSYRNERSVNQAIYSITASLKDYITDIKPNDVKSKINILKNKYIKESENGKSTWKYFQSMDFLRQYVPQKYTVKPEFPPLFTPKDMEQYMIKLLSLNNSPNPFNVSLTEASTSGIQNSTTNKINTASAQQNFLNSDFFDLDSDTETIALSESENNEQVNKKQDKSKIDNTKKNEESKSKMNERLNICEKPFQSKMRNITDNLLIEASTSRIQNTAASKINTKSAKQNFTNSNIFEIDSDTDTIILPKSSSKEKINKKRQASENDYTNVEKQKLKVDERDSSTHRINLPKSSSREKINKKREASENDHTNIDKQKVDEIDSSTHTIILPKSSSKEKINKKRQASENDHTNNEKKKLKVDEILNIFEQFVLSKMRNITDSEILTELQKTIKIAIINAEQEQFHDNIIRSNYKI